MMTTTRIVDDDLNTNNQHIYVVVNQNKYYISGDNCNFMDANSNWMYYTSINQSFQLIDYKLNDNWMTYSYVE